MRTHTVTEGGRWAWSAIKLAAPAAVIAVAATHVLAPRETPTTEAMAIEIADARPPAPPAAVTAPAPRERAPDPREKPLEPVGDPILELGRRLFFDPGASHSKKVSCASCHDPEHAYSDTADVSADDFGPTTRHSQTLLNLAVDRPLHWDGEFASVEELVTARTGPTRRTDGGYESRGSKSRVVQVVPVADALAKSDLYARGFQAAFGDSTPTKERLAQAVATYVRTLESTASPYDRWFAGDSTALTKEAVRGLDLFRGRAGCAQCHSIEGDKPSFSDGQFHNTGVVRARTRGADSRERKEQMRAGPEDLGRSLVSKSDLEARSFKTPSLRDVAIRAPYMHDASFATLEAVVRYYAVECGNVNDPRKDARIKPFDAAMGAGEVARDVSALVAFLSSLTGETRAGLATAAWSERAERMRLRVIEKSGAPWRHVVGVAPAGDVVPAVDPGLGVSKHLTPDSGGWIELPPYATTHVRLSFPGSELRPVSGDLVPDICHEGTITLEPDVPVVLEPTGRRR